MKRILPEIFTLLMVLLFSGCNSHVSPAASVEGYCDPGIYALKQLQFSFVSSQGFTDKKEIIINSQAELDAFKASVNNAVLYMDADVMPEPVDFFSKSIVVVMKGTCTGMANSIRIKEIKSDCTNVTVKVETKSQVCPVKDGTVSEYFDLATVEVRPVYMVITDKISLPVQFVYIEDNDADGFTDEAESAAGTDPCDSLSYPGIICPVYELPFTVFGGYAAALAAGFTGSTTDIISSQAEMDAFVAAYGVNNLHPDSAAVDYSVKSIVVIPVAQSCHNTHSIEINSVRTNCGKIRIEYTISSSIFHTMEVCISYDVYYYLAFVVIDKPALPVELESHSITYT